MFGKSLFHRMMIPIIIVVLLSMVMLGVFQIQKLNEFVLVQEKTRLTHMAERLAGMALIAEEQYSPSVEYFFRQNLNAHAKDSGAYIVIVDDRSNLLAFSDNCSDFSARVIVERDAFDHVFKTKTPYVHIGTAQLHRREEVLTVATPILRGQEFYGAVLAYLPLPFLTTAKNEVISHFLLAFIVVSVVAILSLILVAGRVILPIRKLQRAARAVARGDFDTPIDIHSKDEIGELATDFIAMTKSLKDQDQNQRNFIGDLSHELRTPMTTISGFLEGIMDGVIPEEETDKYLRIVLEETHRLSRLVSQLLELTRMDAGEIPYDPKSFDLSEQVRLSLIGAESRIEEKNLSITVDLPETPAFVFADPDQIRRVLNNLIDNAVKFTPSEGALTLSVTPKGGKFQVEVENSGAGIDSDELPHIFDRFYKSDKSRGVDKSGAGLGLYMVRNILKQHGEDIAVKSTPQEFTTFTFALKKA